jgi:carotenoid 1,2-hydratase
LRRDATTPADDHCAINVCLYSPGAARWTMTERAARHVTREARSFQVGPSRLEWRGDSLAIEIDERAAPVPRRVRGRVRLHPQALCSFRTALDAAGGHRWGPIAPCARIEVELDQPALRWSGHAYFDSNEGDEPIERGFERWHWLRTSDALGRTSVIYDVEPLDGGPRVIGARFAADGTATDIEAPAQQRLPPSAIWRIDRRVRSRNDAPPPRVLRTLEDTPFYARSLVELSLDGTRREQAVHETLDVARLRTPVVQMLLPFRMPRRR